MEELFEEADGGAPMVSLIGRIWLHLAQFRSEVLARSPIHTKKPETARPTSLVQGPLDTDGLSTFCHR